MSELFEGSSRKCTGRKGSRAASHVLMSPRASCCGQGICDVICSFGFLKNIGAAPSWVYVSDGRRDDGVLLERRLPLAKVRLEGLVRVGTRNAATEQEAATPRLFVRNACVRALRKHVCAVLIEGWRMGGGGEYS
jgi:hypothetical protein